MNDHPAVIISFTNRMELAARARKDSFIRSSY